MDPSLEVASEDALPSAEDTLRFRPKDRLTLPVISRSGLLAWAALTGVGALLAVWMQMPYFFAPMFAMGASLAIRRKINAPHLELDSSGFDIIDGARFSWKQATWRHDDPGLLFLVLSGRWLPIEIKRYSLGEMLPFIVKARCPQAELPASGIELMTPLAGKGELIDLWVEEDTLHSAQGRIDLGQPITARHGGKGTLILSQGISFVTIHRHAPRRLFIESLPQVARAMEGRAKF